MKSLVLAIFFVFVFGIEQNSADTDTRAILVQLVIDYFEAYNTCDVDKMMSFTSDDIEIYTDFAGTTFGHLAVRQQLINFCSFTSASDQPTIKIEVLGELDIQTLLTKDDQVYGAIVQGKIASYVLNKKSGLADETATNDFFWVMKYVDNKWFISRDVSYNFQKQKK